MRQKAKLAMKADNPRLRMVRIDIVGDARLTLMIPRIRHGYSPLCGRRLTRRDVRLPIGKMEAAGS